MKNFQTQSSCSDKDAHSIKVALKKKKMFANAVKSVRNGAHTLSKIETTQNRGGDTKGKSIDSLKRPRQIESIGAYTPSKEKARQIKKRRHQ